MEFLLRYGELGLKSSRVRRSMTERLIENIRVHYRHQGGECSFKVEEGRVFLMSDYPGTEDILGRTFGLVSYSQVVSTSCELEKIVSGAVDVAGAIRHRGPTFAVRVRRVGDHPYTSMDVAREAGAAILAAHSGLTVDLTNPDWEVFLEIRGEKAYLATDVRQGPGGLPLGSQGKVVALVESPEGALAAWLMMKRGCRVIPVYRSDEEWVETLAYWDPEISGQRIKEMKEMDGIARRAKALGVVLPWSLDNVEEKGLRPAFYPLVGFTKDDLEGLSRRVLERSKAG